MCVLDQLNFNTVFISATMDKHPCNWDTEVMQQIIRVLQLKFENTLLSL